MQPEESKKIICSMHQLSKSINQKQILKDISLSYFYGAKIGVLGLNGAGKSSLLKIMAKVDTDFEGSFTINDKYSIGYLPQEPKLDEEKTVRAEVETAVADVKNLLVEFQQISDEFANISDDQTMQKLIDRQAKVQNQIDELDAWSLDSRLDMAMNAMRCPDPDLKTGVLSGGEKRRVALCKILLQKPDILLLDEPTNHLDAETVAFLEHQLKNYPGTVIAVTHDRYFLDNIAGWILELDRGSGIPFEGNYSSWLRQKEKRLQTESAQQDSRLNTLKRELEWINMTPKARHTKSKARITAYENLLAEDENIKIEQVEIYIPPGPRLGKIVLEVNNLAMHYDDKILFENLNFSLPAGSILGIVGANGAGKTSLFKILSGQKKATSGSFKLGDTVKIAYADQDKSSLDEEKTVFEEICQQHENFIFGKKTINARAYVAKFGFSGTRQQQKIKDLSGGAKNRVNLAKTLTQQANLLLLDEPTNDLDVNTLSALETGLNNFTGSALVISHDRWFLDRISTHILGFENEGKVVFFEDNYSQYEADLKKRLNVDSLIPAKLKYRRLSR